MCTVTYTYMSDNDDDLLICQWQSKVVLKITCHTKKRWKKVIRNRNNIHNNNNIFLFYFLITWNQNLRNFIIKTTVSNNFEEWIICYNNISETYACIFVRYESRDVGTSETTITITKCKEYETNDSRIQPSEYKKIF